MATARIEAIDAAPLLGSLIDKAVEGGHHEALITSGLRGIGKSIVREPRAAAYADRRRVSLVGSRAG